MKFVSVNYKGEELPGILVKNDSSVVLFKDVLSSEYKCMNDFISNHLDSDYETLLKIEKDKVSYPSILLKDVTLLSPIPSARHDIICVGINYVDHLEETRTHFYNGSFETPKDTVYFSKRASNIVGPDKSIDGHYELDEAIDYEVEVALIIGKKVDKNTSYEDVSSSIFGYAVFNDISARNTQSSHLQWYLGKSFDSFSVMGPYILSADKLKENPSLELESRVNGEVRQHSNTKLLRMNFSDLIYDISRGITLEPGDIIATGTPSGVGMGFTPPRYLKKGDVVECIVEELGVLRNTIV